ncbi:hypothetical protein B0H13DRAFT_2572902 [Mycena leptocephala]|nr:hypothetical protein B0H13DRAFT_2572902 [Mycena leptocephala]
MPVHLDRDQFNTIPAPDPAIFLSLEDAFPQLAVAGPRMIQVLDFNPNEGEEGAPITVRIHFHSESSEPIHVRLVVGNKAVSTAMELDAAAPALGHPSTADNKVLITVQALNAENTVLDSVLVVSRHGTSPRRHTPSFAQSALFDAFPFSLGPRSSVENPSRKKDVQKCIKDQSLVRARHHAPGELDENLHAHTPLLDIVTPLDSLCSGWDDAELEVGRRLVRFQKIQDGRRVILSCEPIKQEQYCEADSVISCIYREETETCYVTSVDIIYLLERLTNDEFPVEEKNRIRRNLEGLRPTTVSKHKPGSEVFFQRIMDFPDPKPRNIEKDLKVFEWVLLGQALEKIMSKYSIYTSSPTDSTTSLPEESATELLQSQTHVSSHIDPTLVNDKRSLDESLLFTPSNHYKPHQSPLSLRFRFSHTARA